jgi:hypothetical protein
MVIINKNWPQHGIRYIHDIVDAKGEILKQKQLEDKFVFKCKQLEYQGISSTIPKEWKNMLRNNSQIHSEIPDDCIIIEISKKRRNLNDISTKDVYIALLGEISKRPTSETKWREKTEFEITPEMWNMIHTNHLKVTNDRYLRNFQYKIINRILAVNYNLEIWKIKTKNTCDFCEEIDTIEHFLYQCPKTHTFWQFLFNWWAANIPVRFNINIYEILFGIPNEHNEPIVNQLNFFILHSKLYIYHCKKKNNNMNVFEVIKEIRKQILLKHHNFIEAKKAKQFQEQWGELYNSLVE